MSTKTFSICLIGVLCGIVGILICAVNNRYCEKITISYTVKEIIFHEQSTEIIYNTFIKSKITETIKIIPFNPEADGKRKIINNTQFFLCKETDYGETCNIVDINKASRDDIWDLVKEDFSTDNCKDFEENLQYSRSFVFLIYLAYIFLMISNAE